MKRRIGSLCVALAMCLGLLPGITITADASDYTGDITVGGVEMFGSNSGPAYATTDKDGQVTLQSDYTEEDDWTIRWDGTTLTLKGATIISNSGPGITQMVGNQYTTLELVEGTENFVKSNGGDEGHGLYFMGPLTITGGGSLQAEGAYGIYGYGWYTRIESGTVTAIGTFQGFVFDGLTIAGGSVTTNGTKYYGFCGGDLTIAGGTVTATGGQAASDVPITITPGTGLQVTAYTGDSKDTAQPAAQVTHPDSKTITFGPDGPEASAKYFHSESAAAETSRPIMVGGVQLNGLADEPDYALTDSSGQVTKDGASEDYYHIKWDGTTLTLKGAQVVVTGGYGIHLEGDLRIALAEDTENTVSTDNSDGIRVSGSLTISGPGALTATATQSSTITYVDCIGISASQVTIESGTVTATAKQTSTNRNADCIGISASQITIEGGTVTANSDDDGIAVDDFFALRDGMVKLTASKGLHMQGDGEIEISGGTIEATSGSFGIYGAPTLTISGGEVTLQGSISAIVAGLDSSLTVTVDPPPGQIIFTEFRDHNGVETSNPYTEEGTLTSIGRPYFHSYLDTMEEDVPRAQVITPPTPLEPAYNGGYPLLLITEGEAENGTMMYQLVGSWSGKYETTIPEAKNPGTYTIWYYAKGNEGYRDSVPVRMEATIKKKQIPVTTVSVIRTIYDTTPISDIEFFNDGSGTIKLDPGQTLQVGTHSYTWTLTPDEPEYYDIVTGTIELEVVKDTLQTIAVAPPPSKTNYTYGDALDLTGMVVTASYQSGNQVDVTNQVTVTPQTLDTDVTALTISYGGKTTTQQITVSPKEVTNPTMELEGGSSFEVTGSEIRPTVTVKDGDTVIPPEEYTVSYSNNINVGTATVTITDNVDGNYTVSGSTTFEITKAKAAVTTVPAAENLTYDGQAHALVTAGTATGGTLMYRLGDSGAFSDEIPTGTDAGDYTVWYYVKGDGDHSDTQPVKVEVTIEKAAPAYTVPTDLTAVYGATLDDVTLTDGWAWDTPDTTVGDVGSNTFSATFTPGDTGNYNTVTQNLTVTVSAKDINGAQVTLGNTLTYTGQQQTQIISSVTVDGLDVTYTVTGNTGTGAGDYTLTITGTGNFIGKVEQNWSIAKATAAEDMKAANGSVPAGYTSSVTLPAIPAGASCGEPQYTGSDLTDLKISGNTLSYTGGSGVGMGQTYTVTIPVDGGANYQDYTITVTLTGTDKKVPAGAPILSTATITYGQSLSTIGLSGSMKDGETDVTGTFAWDAPDTTPSAGSYEAHWTFTPDDGAQYVSVTGRSAITVSKATPTGAPRYTAITTSGKTLSDAGLTTEGSTFSVKGTVTWELANTTEVMANTSYRWIFTPEDTHNYNSISGSTELWHRSFSGGSSGDPTYSVTLPGKITGGEITMNKRYAEEGETVTLTAIPDEGYELDTLIVTDSRGRELDLKYEENGEYSFKMPAGRVEIEVSFREIGSVLPFTDVAEDHWAVREISWALENGYMNGTSAAAFHPSGTVSRQQVWMILSRMAGADPADMAAAKAWAVANGISDGTNPGGAVTRQQLAALLYRFAVQNGYDVSIGENTNLLSYTDFANLSEYAVPAMQWACGAGIITGTGDGSTLSPQGTATRAQLAVMLYRWLA